MDRLSLPDKGINSDNDNIGLLTRNIWVPRGGHNVNQMNTIKKNLSVGDRIVVAGYNNYVVKISDIIHVREEARRKFVLTWENGGTSYIYDHDEGVVWYRYNTTNLLNVCTAVCTSINYLTYLT